MGKGIQIDAARMGDHPGEMVRGPVEVALDDARWKRSSPKPRRQRLVRAAGLLKESSHETLTLPFPTSAPLSAIGSKQWRVAQAQNQQSAGPIKRAIRR